MMPSTPTTSTTSNRPSKMQRVRVGEIEQTFAEVGTFIKDVYIDKDMYSPGRLFLSFKMGLASPDYVGTLVGNYFFTLEDIIATYLYTTRRRAEAQLETDLETIVLGCPVRYSDTPNADAFARERMIQAAFRAGYKTVYMQYEPLAAATYYESTLDHDENVLIFDFGGGTLDMSVLHLGRGRQILANGGIPIAGNVFDTRIVRAKMPAHFGEGEGYYSSGKKLPSPIIIMRRSAVGRIFCCCNCPTRWRRCIRSRPKPRTRTKSTPSSA
ncbi:Hsp70 family protein [bacterium]|nr:Hsp70 family protein [bacterium]